MLREHGPNHSTLKLCVWAVNSFMDEAGWAFPSQAKIARSASITEKTAQKMIALAIDAEWLSVAVSIENGGKGWKRYEYRAMVPDGLEDTIRANDKWAQQLDAFLGQHGTEPKRGRPFARVSNALAAKPSREPLRPERGSNGPLLNSIGSERGSSSSPFKSPLVPLEVPSKCSLKSSFEVHVEVPIEGALARTAPDDTQKLRKRILKTEAEAKAKPHAQPAISKEELFRKVKKLSAVESDVNVITRQLQSQGATQELVIEGLRMAVS